MRYNMQTELDTKTTDMASSADVSSGTANTVDQTAMPQEAPNVTGVPEQKPEPKKRGRKKGYHHSEATKAAMRKARTGVHPSKETKDKISKAKEGKTHSATAKLKMSDTRRYNFLRKKLESALNGSSSLSDLFTFFMKKDAMPGPRSDFAKNIYDMADDKVNQLINTKADTKTQKKVYAEIIKTIKERYDERIQELSTQDPE